MLLYSTQDFESAYPFYTKLFELFPNKIEYMKGYAEVLYLKGSLSELAYLARYCVVLNRDCFETCHVCGNSKKTNIYIADF